MTSNKLPAPIEELNVEAEVTERGLKGVVRSRAIVAIDRLAGNLIDVPSVYLETFKRRIEVRAEVKDALLEREGRAAVEKLEGKAEVGDRVVDSFLRKEARRQANQEAVARKTLDELVALPPPNDVSEDDDKQLDDDWLNLFSDHAENASSERLRDMWGRVLAGEIRNPGTFSLTTLRFISELDREIAESFQKAVRPRLQTGFIPKPANMAGRLLLELTFLEEVGLLQEVNGGLGQDIPKSEDGYIYYFNSDIEPDALLLRIKTAVPRVELIKITRVGREIASILPIEPPTVALEAVASQFMPRSTHVELCRVSKVYSTNESEAMGNIDYESVKIIKAPGDGGQGTQQS